MLDAGLSANIIPEYIFITHQHSDHVANLPYHLYGNNGLQVFVPNDSKQKFQDYIISAYFLTLNTSETDKISEIQNTNIIGVSDDEPDFDIQTKKNNKTIHVEIIKCDHTVPCVSFGFSENKYKLKHEYKSLSGKEIKAFKDQNVDICDTIPHYFLLFLGDTSREVLKDQRIIKYRNVMIECTFLYADDLDQADKTKHIHWNYMKQFVIDNPNTNFILYHFSQRYKKEEIDDFFKNEKTNIPNIIIWNSS